MGNSNNNILIVSSEFPPDPGGIGNHAYNLAVAFASKGKNITVVADINNATAAQLASFQSSIPFTFKALVRKRAVVLTYLARITAVLQAARYNNFIICSGKFSLWLILLLKLWYPSKKYVAVVHGTELDLKSPRAKRLTGASLQKFNGIIAVSSYTQSFIPAGVKSSVYNCIIPNGINNKEFIPYYRTARPVSFLAQDVLPIITIGNVTERKGQENVVRAMPAMLKVFPNLHYHIAGKPTSKQAILKIAEALGVTQHITFHGMMERGELLLLLSKCAVKFMLSNHTASGDFEGFGIAILEANALGIPAVGANFGGITDAIQDSKTGRLADVHDAEQITESLQQIINSYSAYSADALQWAKAHDWSILIGQYEHVLEKLA